MRTLPFLLFMLLIPAMLCVVSCQDESAIDRPAGEEKTLPDIYFFDTPLQEHLEMLWKYSESITYDTVQGYVVTGIGGTVSGYPQSWGPNYEFRIEVPPGALTGQYGTLTPITLKIPRNSRPHIHAVYILEPDGLEFQEPVSVTLCYPPWLIHGQGLRQYVKYRFFKHDYGHGYGMSDYEEGYAYSADFGPTEITFETMHFSRWVLEDGK